MNPDTYFGPGNLGPLQTDYDRKYWTAAVASELKAVAANTERGCRNDQLFRSACRIFSIVKSGIGSYEKAEDLLIEAATDSGYAADEPQQMMATLASAWKKVEPRDLTKRDGALAPILASPGVEYKSRRQSVPLNRGCAGFDGGAKLYRS